MPIILDPPVPAPDEAAGHYADQGDVETAFGVENVRQWSNLDGSTTATDTARVQAALNHADSWMDSKLGKAGYETPIDDAATDFALLTDAAARIAGVWLYESRGMRDTDPETGAPVHKLWPHRKQAQDTVNRLLVLGIGGATRTHTDVPTGAAAYDENGGWY